MVSTMMGMKERMLLRIARKYFYHFCSQLNLDLWNGMRTCFQTQLSKF